jgi:TetR/AcrR family transcriptional regulator
MATATPLTPAPTARRRSQTRIGEANAGRILDAALSVFARHGFGGARVDRIAEAAGMSKANLLYYFRTKEALYLAVLTRTLDMWLEPLRELDASRDPAEALGHYIERKLEYSRFHPEASRLFAMEIMQGAPMLSRVLATDLAALVERKVATIERWVADGRLAPVDPHHLIFMIWATTQHYADFAAQIRALTGKDLGDGRFFEGTAQAVVGNILRGVLPRG